MGTRLERVGLGPNLAPRCWLIPCVHHNRDQKTAVSPVPVVNPTLTLKLGKKANDLQSVETRLIEENKALSMERSHLSDLMANVQKMHNDIERSSDRRRLEGQIQLLENQRFVVLSQTQCSRPSGYMGDTATARICVSSSTRSDRTFDMLPHSMRSKFKNCARRSIVRYVGSCINVKQRYGCNL